MVLGYKWCNRDIDLTREGEEVVRRMWEKRKTMGTERAMNDTLLLNLRLVAALAAKLANDVENKRLWEGEALDAISALEKALTDAAREIK